MVTTDSPFDRRAEVLRSERPTETTLDRLTHRCQIIEPKGGPCRLRDAEARLTNRPARAAPRPPRQSPNPPWKEEPEPASISWMFESSTGALVLAGTKTHVDHDGNVVPLF